MEGKQAVLFTTNGTTALCAVAGQAVTYAGAVANAGELARVVAGEHSSVTIVCAGNARARTFSLEDFAASGAIVRALVAAATSATVGDAARLAAGTPLDWIGTSQHAELLRTIGLGPDVEFCGRLDTAGSVPRVTNAGPGYAVLTR